MKVSNIFDSLAGGTMNYGQFKKIFFPHYCHAQADEKEAYDHDSVKGHEETQTKTQMEKN